MSKSIAFLLPKEKPFAVGGYKVVFEYANRLADEGYEVFLVYASTLFWSRYSFLDKVKILAYHLKMKWRRHTRVDNWFDISSKVRQIRVLTPSEKFVPRFDFYVATAIQAAYYLKNYAIPNSRKLYLIQDFENWQYSDEQVYDTYCFGMKNIVISHWLQKRVEACGAHATLIPNGFDFDFFKLSNPIADRNPYSIAFMYHVEERKGCDISINAFNKVKEKYPQLVVNTFSAYPKPNDLPDWYDFHQLPDKSMFNHIYNESAIYVAASYVEGWGLTVGEAMICGCAVACTDNQGFLEMAKNEHNALVVPVGNEDALADAIVRLIENGALRAKLASQARDDIKQFNWNIACKKFKEVLES